MKEKAKLRFLVLLVIMLAMMAALIVKLGNLTLAKGEDYVRQAQSRKNATSYTTGARGRILDRNGIPLAYDETSFDVQFWRDPERLSSDDSAMYTESIIEAIRVIEAGGGTIINASYIQKNPETGLLEYDWGVTSESAVYARYRNYCEAMGFNIRDDAAQSGYKPVEEWPTAEQAYLKSRSMWEIPEDLPFEEAVKIMSVRQEVNLNKWRAYEPVTMAYNVSIDVVAELEMRSEELVGIQTKQSTARVYPWGSTASHIVGYLGRQVTDEATLSSMQAMGYSEELLEEYEYDYSHDEYGALLTDDDGDTYTIYARDDMGNRVVRMTRMGYSYNDYIGVAGIERTMEQYLTANTTRSRGTQSVEINKHGTVTRVLETTAPTDGNDVMLTIDLALQQVTEQALADAIAAIRAYEEELLNNPEKHNLDADHYTEKRSDLSTVKMAETGAIVVLDANNGDALAIASYPSFDPNVFIKGISDEEFATLFGEGSNQPTLNRAIGSRLAPGSIFKMATGLAGLMEGELAVEEEIPDEGKRYTQFVSGEVIKETEAPRCWTSSATKHKEENNLKNALSRSCNYYFYTVADRLGIDRLNQWATDLGLGVKTNIQLPGELTGHIGGQKVLYDNTLRHNQQKGSLPNYVYNKLVAYLKDIVELRGIEASEDAIDRCAERILQLQGGAGTSQEFGEGIREALRDELGVPVNATRQNRWAEEMSSMLTELRWKPVMTVSTGIGQGISLVTPVAVARYAAAFANEGTVYDVNIVDRVIDTQGRTVYDTKPTVLTKVEAPEVYWKTIQEGLSGVISDEDQGTATGSFTEEFITDGYRDKIIGKSGTAQISTAANNIDIENTSWFVTMAPKDDPQIVIITCIPNGLSGSRGGAPAVEQIIRYYIDRIENAANDNLVRTNGIVP